MAPVCRRTGHSNNRLVLFCHKSRVIYIRFTFKDALPPVPHLSDVLGPKVKGKSSPSFLHNLTMQLVTIKLNVLLELKEPTKSWKNFKTKKNCSKKEIKTAKN